MSNTADLSVVIPTYNHAKYLPRALQALVTQSVSPAEVIVVNDASTDETPAILEAFARDYPVIKVITNAQNRRTNESVRIGMAHATGKYLYCVASDDYVLPGFVEKMVGALEANPQAGICSAYFSIVNGDTGELRPNPSGWCTEPRYFAPSEVERVIAHSSIPGHASVLKRSSLDAAGGFLPELEWHSDWFLSLVVAFRDGMCHVPEMLALLTDLPQSYCSNGMRSEKQLTVLNAIYDRLASSEYADVAPAFRRSGVLSVFGPPVVRAAARRSDLWSKPMLGLINGLRTDEYKSLLDDTNPEVRELAAFFLGPFWHEIEQRHNREAELQSMVVAQQQAFAALQETLVEKDQAVNHAKERVTEALQKLGTVNQLLAESEARREELEAVAAELQETVQATESSHIWKFRTLLRDCKRAAIKQLKKAA